MLRIEFEEPNLLRCDCCGNTAVRLTRCVFENNDAPAVYFALYTPGHPEKVVRGIIGLGEWGDDETDPEARRAFPFEIREASDQFEVGMADASASTCIRIQFCGVLMVDEL